MIYTVYAKEDDMTFIMKDTINGDVERLKCVGMYFGSPDEDLTNKYIGKLTAEFMIEEE